MWLAFGAESFHVRVSFGQVQIGPVAILEFIQNDCQDASASIQV